MYIEIFQPIEDYDMAYMSYEKVMDNYNKIPAEYYQKVYACASFKKHVPLGDIFMKFNFQLPNDYPLGYLGHSLSIGDIIKIKEAKKGFKYIFIDKYGYKFLKDEFNEEEIRPRDFIRVLIKEPNKKAYSAEIPRDKVHECLCSITRADKKVFIVDPHVSDDVQIVVNDEKIMTNLPLNFVIDGGEIHGNVCFINISTELNGDFDSLTEGQIRKYKNMF